MTQAAMQKVALPLDRIATFCERNHIRKLSLFGSVLRDDFRPDSDLDMLVAFELDAHVGYFELVEMETELSTLVGRKVDLRTAGELSKYFRDSVIDSSELIYAATN